MNGFISSLLIEAVFRQARHLSLQTNTGPSSDNDLAASLSSPQTDIPSADDNGEKAIVSPGQEHSGMASIDAHTNLPDQFSPTMDNRNGEADRLSQIRHGGHGSETTSSNCFNSPFGTPHELNSQVNSVGIGTAQSLQSTDRTATHNAHQPERSPGDTFAIDELGQLLLPEDDGMGVLRRKIHTIRDNKTVSSAEKARMIHDLMTESYNISRGSSSNRPLSMTLSQSSPRSVDRPVTPASRWSGCSFDQMPITPASTASVAQVDDPYNLTPEDLTPTYAPKIEPESPLCDTEDVETEEFDEPCLGCQHYKRNVKLQCYTCHKWYTCRFCHDEVEDHLLIRNKTQHMLCMLCKHAQPAAQWCRKCGEQAAQYYCNVCKLWDNDSKKSIYHCNDCGICRIGQGLGKDFFHCKTCSVCLPISIETAHRCIERSTQCDCPICGDYMFTSPETVVVMRCGHSIHHKCLSEYSKSSYRCPICSKTITNMESTFRNLDRTIQSQPMPAEFKDTNALVYCNDCGAKSVVKYHWLGLKCDLCESYNTAQLQLLHGDSAQFSETDDDSRTVPASRMRSSSYAADEDPMSSGLASLRISTSSMPGTNLFSRLNTPSADPSGQSSYSLTRGRALSPVISNYFGLPTARETTASPSGDQAQKDNGSDNGDEFHFWGTKIKYRYGFLGGDTESVDGVSEADAEDGTEALDDEEEDEEDDQDDQDDGDDDDDDDDDIESIDIFGHR